MSRRTSNKKAKQKILSYLNRNIPKGEVKFGYYCLSDSPKSYCLRKGGAPYTMTKALFEIQGLQYKPEDVIVTIGGVKVNTKGNIKIKGCGYDQKKTI
tara:strand:+ start:3166 stop:3459 length:294 start_codon:yes stop_codon:yes gene_type:complete